MVDLSSTQRSAARRIVDRVGEDFAQDPPLARGAQLARYVIIDRAGSGGLGDVYRAYDPKLDRCVAIKLIRSEGPASEDAKQRLAREAQALAQLDHPNVVTVFDFGSAQDRLFVAMEFIDGQTLTVWLREQQPTWSEIRDAFVSAAVGLSAAHARGIIHRDFKLDNVLMDKDGRARVVDFGLARAVGPASTAQQLAIEGDPTTPRLDHVLTQHGTVMGTPAYMAPEQLQGAAVDARADQFAFCVGLFRALYEQWPFAAKKLNARLDEIRTTEPRPKSNPRQVPTWLRRALLRGLAADPDDRYESMTALVHELTRDKRSRRRQRWLTVGASALIGAVVATVALLTPPALNAEDEAKVELLVAQARAAADAKHYIYPDPAEATASALARIIELEASNVPTAEQRARELRAEFAEALTKLGDEFAERPGGAAYASDYYAAAVLFDPRRDDARSRTSLSPGELATLRQQAEQGTFSASEIAVGEMLARLAQPDGAHEILHDTKPKAASSRRRLEDITEAPAAPQVDPVPVAADVPSPAPVRAPSRRPEAAAPETVVGGASEVDPDALRTELEKGRAAAAAADYARAEKHFHRALAASPRSAEALAGVAEAHFERQQYTRALKYARRAVKQSPASARYRLLLGDAFFKVYDYRAAQREYLEAQRQGSKVAAKRLAKLEGKLSP